MNQYSPKAILEVATESDVFGQDSPCPIFLEEGDIPEVWVISGENAGGKSILCKAIQGKLQAIAKKDNQPFVAMRVGMDMRTDSGIVRGMMFGSEQYDSTGNNSVQTALTGLKSARERDELHWLILDEPDIGLGAGYRKALGEAFADFAQNLPEKTLGFMVVTHASEIVGPLINAGASSIRVGPDRRPVREWLRDGDLPKSFEDLQNLNQVARQTWRDIEDVTRNRDKPATPFR